jgi:hypothetical protein
MIAFSAAAGCRARVTSGQGRICEGAAAKPPKPEDPAKTGRTGRQRAPAGLGFSYVFRLARVIRKFYDEPSFQPTGRRNNLLLLTITAAGSHRLWIGAEDGSGARGILGGDVGL